MKKDPGFSLMQPMGTDAEYHRLPDNVLHDLGLDAFFGEISTDAKERRFIMNVI